MAVFDSRSLRGHVKTNAIEAVQAAAARSKATRVARDKDKQASDADDAHAEYLSSLEFPQGAASHGDQILLFF